MPGGGRGRKLQQHAGVEPSANDVRMRTPLAVLFFVVVAALAAGTRFAEAQPPSAPANLGWGDGPGSLSTAEGVWLYWDFQAAPDSGTFYRYRVRSQGGGFGSWMRTGAAESVGGDRLAAELVGRDWENHATYTVELQASTGEGGAAASITFTPKWPNPPRSSPELSGRLARRDSWSRPAEQTCPSSGKGRTQMDDVLRFFLLWSVRTCIFLVLAMPLIVTPGVFFPFVVGKAVYARSIIEIAFAFWFVLVLFYRRYRPQWSWTIFAFSVWLLVSWIAGIFGVSPTRSLWSTYERMQGVFDLAHWFAFTLMVGSAFRSVADWRRLFSINLACSTAMCSAGLAHYYDVIGISLLGDSAGRISSTLGNATYVGAYAMVNALLGVALIVQSLGRSTLNHRRQWVRGLWALMVLINLWTLWLSGTRGAMVGLGAASVIFAAYAMWGQVRVARRMAWAVLAAVVIAAAFLTVARTTTLLDPVIESSGTLSRIANTGPRDQSIGVRVAYAAAGLRAFLDRPVLGWGPENFLIAWGRHHTADVGGSRADHAHSKPIEELTTKGVAGLLSYFAIWTIMTYVVLRSLRRLSGCDQLYVYIIGAALASYFIQNLFLFDTPPTVMQFSLLTAFVVSMEAGGGLVPERAGGGAQPPRLLDNLRASVDRSRGLLTALAVSVIALTIVSLALFNVRLYSAAAAVVDAADRSRPWSCRLEDFARSIREFPGLANYARLFLSTEASIGIGAMSDEDFRRTVELVTTEARRGLADEPQNWRLEAVLAGFYQNVAERDTAYLEVARRHVDRAAELAPGVPDVLYVVNEQEESETAAAGVNSGSVSR